MFAKVSTDDKSCHMLCLRDKKINFLIPHRALIRQICSIKPEDVATVRSSELLAKLELEDLNLVLREKALVWRTLVWAGAVRTACDIQDDGRQGVMRSKLT